MGPKTEAALAAALAALMWAGEEVELAVGAMPEPVGMSLSARRIGFNPAPEPAVRPVAELVPRRTRFVAITNRRILMMGGKMRIGGALPGELLADMTIDQVDEANVIRAGLALQVRFTDGSTVLFNTDDPRRLLEFAS